MKYGLLIIAIGAVLAGFFFAQTKAPSGPTVPNGSFESGVWRASSVCPVNAPDEIKRSETQVEGKYSLELIKRTKGELCVRQAIKGLEAGKKYELSFSYRWQQGEAPRFRIIDALKPEDEALTQPTVLSKDPRWQEQVISYEPPAPLGDVSLEFSTTYEKGPATVVNFDDVRIEAALSP